MSNSYPTSLLSASGNSVKLLGTLTTNVSVAGSPFETEFVVVDGLTHNIILGLSMLQQHKAVVDLANNSLSLADVLTCRSARASVASTVAASNESRVCSLVDRPRD